jgi:hypothetical protein
MTETKVFSRQNPEPRRQVVEDKTRACALLVQREVLALVVYFHLVQLPLCCEDMQRCPFY